MRLFNRLSRMICRWLKDDIGCGNARLFQPADRVAHRDIAVIQYFTKGAALPICVHGLLQTGPGFLHALTRFGFAENTDATHPDAQDTPAAPGEANPAEHQIRPPRGWRQSSTELCH